MVLHQIVLPPPQPSPAADAGASCEGGGKLALAILSVSSRGKDFFVVLQIGLDNHSLIIQR